jgi:hypothetical protein
LREERDVPDRSAEERYTDLYLKQLGKNAPLFTAEEMAVIGSSVGYWGPKLVAETWNVREIYITENGVSSADVIAPMGTYKTRLCHVSMQLRHPSATCNR